MALVLDSGAFVAIEKGEGNLAARIKRERLAGRVPVTHGGVVAQVWRGGSGRQAGLARAVDLVEVVALDRDLGKAAGRLLALTGGRDVVDAAVVMIASDDDQILTSDPEDLLALASARGLFVEIESV